MPAPPASMDLHLDCLIDVLHGMDPILGGKKEYLALFGLLAASMFILKGRRTNEEGLRS